MADLSVMILRMSEERRIVITGIGPVTPCGIGMDDFWNSLKTGKSGISYLDSPIDQHGIESPVKFGGEIKNFNVENYFSDPKQIRSMAKDMDPVSRFAMVSAKLAIEDAALDFDVLEKESDSNT